jgi:RNA polymerase sigma-70 factor (ECF subfamily)
LHEQDSKLWDKELIQTGELYLRKAANGEKLSKYHVEAAIAYWHTQTADDQKKWRKILDYYNILLQIEYSPMAALNRTYALAKAENVEKAIEEALKLKLETNHLYFALLGELFSKAQKHTEANIQWNKALLYCKNDADRRLIQLKIDRNLLEIGKN